MHLLSSWLASMMAVETNDTDFFGLRSTMQTHLPGRINGIYEYRVLFLSCLAAKKSFFLSTFTQVESLMTVAQNVLYDRSIVVSSIVDTIFRQSVIPFHKSS